MISAKASLLWTISPDCGQITDQSGWRSADSDSRSSAAAPIAYLETTSCFVRSWLIPALRWSVAEVTCPGHEHRSPGGIDGIDDLGIPDRATGLDERRHAGLEAHLDGVRERIERIRRAGRAGASA